MYNLATLPYNQILPKVVIILDGDPYVVLSSQTAKKDRQKASNFTKLRNLRTGNVIDRTFHQADSVTEADMAKRDITYLFYKAPRPAAGKSAEYWFCEIGKPHERFALEESVVGNVADYMPENSTVEALIFDDEIIGVTVPIKVDLTVTEAAPAVRGNTSQGATKEVILETGKTIQVPMFINEGDVVRINTDTNSYTERVSKA